MAGKVKQAGPRFKVGQAVKIVTIQGVELLGEVKQERFGHVTVEFEGGRVLTLPVRYLSEVE
jgi:sorbitol-specific phosphotransferase system component IIA